MVEVDATKQPAEGEVMIFTVGGGFVVKGSMPDIVKRLGAEDWAHFELAESNDTIIIRSAQVVALREGKKSKRGSGIGFVH